MTSNKITLELIELLEKHNINVSNISLEFYETTQNLYINIQGKPKGE